MSSSPSTTDRSARHDELIGAAAGARDRAYAPYSGCRVGAALLTRSGAIIVGCNVENAAFSPTMCAERVAVGRAVAEGQREFDAIAVVSETGMTPCGVCRQVLWEFSHDLIVIVADARGVSREYGIDALLPDAVDARDVLR